MRNEKRRIEKEEESEAGGGEEPWLGMLGRRGSIMDHPVHVGGGEATPVGAPRRGGGQEYPHRTVITIIYVGVLQMLSPRGRGWRARVPVISLGFGRAG